MCKNKYRIHPLQNTRKINVSSRYVLSVIPLLPMSEKTNIKMFKQKSPPNTHMVFTLRHVYYYTFPNIHNLFQLNKVSAVGNEM